MHPGSSDFSTGYSGERVGTDKSARRVREDYTGGQLKLSTSRILWLRPTVMKNKSVSGKRFSFLFCPASGDNTGRLHELLAVEIIVTHRVLTTILALFANLGGTNRNRICLVRSRQNILG